MWLGRVSGDLGYDGSNVMLEFANIAIATPLTPDSNWHQYVGVYGGGALSSDTSRLYMDGASLHRRVWVRERKIYPALSSELAGYRLPAYAVPGMVLLTR